MGAFSLIEQRRYRDFCTLYEQQHSQPEPQNPDPDLAPGNYILALLAAEQYPELEQACLRELERLEQIRRTALAPYRGLSLGYFRQGRWEQAAQALRQGAAAKYQDQSRTAAGCLLYYQAAAQQNQALLRESRRMLASRLRGKEADAALAAAYFLLDRCGEQELLQLAGSEQNPVLRRRRLVQAQFYLGVKHLEQGRQAEYLTAMRQAAAQYESCPAVVLEYEFHQAEWILKQHAAQQNTP